tara:strand:- start:29174 stop:29530 length:357 start_codon:yes stop_codon:yes gene_type:complete
VSAPVPELPAGVALDLAALPLEFEPVPAAQRTAGEPETGYAVLGTLGEAELGVWEMTTGGMRDVEVDEVFVVLDGRATVAFEDGRPSVELAPGVLVQLTAGDRTVWTVRQRIRKLVVS